MRLLEEFIYSLSRSERKRLRPLQFRGNKRAIFLRLLRSKARGGSSAVARSPRGSASAGRLDQVVGEILDACYHDIVPAGGTHLLMYLGNKQLFRHFVSVFRAQETALRSDPARLKRFYADVIVMAQFFLLDSKNGDRVRTHVERCSREYAAMLNESESSRLLRTFDLIDELRRTGSQHYDGTRHAAARIGLEGIYAEARNSDDPVTAFLAVDRLMLDSSRHSGKPDARHYAREAMELVRSRPKVFSLLAEQYVMECRLQLEGNDGVSVKELQRFLTLTCETLGPSVYQIGRFLPRILREGDRKWVKQFIESHFPHDLQLLPREAALTYSTLLVIYDIYLGELDEAQQHLHRAYIFSSGRKQISANALALRCYDAYLTAMRGDHIASETALMKHIRFARTNGYHTGERRALLFLDTLLKLIRCVDHDPKRANKIATEYAAQSGTNLFGFQVQQFYSRYFPHHNSK